MHSKQLVRSLIAVCGVAAITLAIFPVPGADASAASLPLGPPIPVCPRGGPPGTARCHLALPGSASPRSAAAPDPTALSPATLLAVYGFPTPPAQGLSFGAANLPGGGQTIAIVDAYDDPTAEADLNIFSAQYGLPTCTTASGCFTKVDQN